MEERVHVSLLGKQYVVPAELTIMDAMEYAGFKLVRGCGCRSGFCGACAVVYRMAGKTEIKVALACQTKEATSLISELIHPVLSPNISRRTKR